MIFFNIFFYSSLMHGTSVVDPAICNGYKYYRTRRLDAKHQKWAETFVEWLEMILEDIIMRCLEIEARGHMEHACQQ